MVQCIAKQASGIVRGTKQKQKRREYMIKKLNDTGQFRNAKRVETAYKKAIISKPTLKDFRLELDSRFVKIETNSKNSFDCWLTLSSVGNKIKLNIPLKRTSVFNKWFKRGRIKNGIRLSKNDTTIMFGVEDKEKKKDGEIIGIDVGSKNTISCSKGFFSKPNNHGHDLTTISERLSRKQKGSNGFAKEQAHRDNYINWSIKQLNLSNAKQVNIENIKQLRFRKKSSRKLSHWTYAKIFERLERKCEEEGVLLKRISPTYTSQRCSNCGWTRKRNRKGKSFKCDKCGFLLDSDLNASRNISFSLPEISRKQRLSRPNINGFYWLAEGQESIVPVVKKSLSVIKANV
jgi:IS605 OrfB family transposase